MQNYVTPLRLVLSPADMAAIFINLEVRVRPGLLWGGPPSRPAPKSGGLHLEGAWRAAPWRSSRAGEVWLAVEGCCPFPLSGQTKPLSCLVGSEHGHRG